MGSQESRSLPGLASVARLTVWSGLQGASGVGPLERLGEYLIEVGDKRQQFVAEVGHGGEIAAADDLAHDHAEDDLDLIEP